MSGFIPKTYSKQQVTVRVDESLLKKIDELAAELKLSRSELFNQCISYALDDMKNKTE